jgi:hypothetical protein
MRADSLPFRAEAPLLMHNPTKWCRNGAPPTAGVRSQTENEDHLQAPDDSGGAELDNRVTNKQITNVRACVSCCVDRGPRAHTALHEFDSGAELRGSGEDVEDAVRKVLKIVDTDGLTPPQ